MTTSRVAAHWRIRRTELAVLEALGGGGLVFLSHNGEQGDALAFDLPVHRGPVGHGAPRRRRAMRRHKQLAFQGGLIQSRWERPGEPGQPAPAARTRRLLVD